MFNAHSFHRVASIFQWFCIRFVGIPSSLSLSLFRSICLVHYFVVLSKDGEQERERELIEFDSIITKHWLMGMFCSVAGKIDVTEYKIATRSTHNKTCTAAVAVPSFCIWCTWTFSIYWNRTKELMRGKERQETKQTERTNIKCDVDAETLNWIEFLRRNNSS